MINFHIGKIILNTENNLNSFKETYDTEVSINELTELGDLLSDHEMLSVLVGLFRISDEQQQIKSNLRNLSHQLLCDENTLKKSLLKLFMQEMIDLEFISDDDLSIKIRASEEALGLSCSFKV